MDLTKKTTKKKPKKKLSKFDINEKKEWELVKDFKRSKLSGKGFTYKNGIGLIYLRNEMNKFDCVNEAISTIEHCKSCLPQNSIIKFSGIQLVIETKNELTNDEILALTNMGFLYQGSIVPFEKDEVWVSTVFAQDPDYWSKDFEDFLKTYPDYLQKKYKKMIRKHVKAK